MPQRQALSAVNSNDEAVTSAAYIRPFRKSLEVHMSAYWSNKALFSHMQERLRSTLSLSDGWDGQDAEAPNAIARALTNTLLRDL